MSLYDERLGLGPEPYQVDTIQVPLSSLRDVQIEGRSATQGGGFIGGGFGAKGAIEGMAVSSVLNTVTTKTKRWVLVSITGDGGSTLLRLDGADQADAKTVLRPIVAGPKPVLPAVADISATDQTNESEDLVGSLERLGQLNQSGVLTDQEFRHAKSKLIGPPDQADWSS